MSLLTPTEEATFFNAPCMRRSAVTSLALSVVLSFVSVLGFGVAAASAQSVGARFSAHSAGSTQTVDHSVWTKLLGTYVVVGGDGLNRVAYAKFKSNGHRQLKAYVGELETVDVAALDRPEQFAFWANLYNAKTIDIILDHYPVTSIKKINLGGSLRALVTGGPWKAKVVKVKGVALSLDDIEHGILRKNFAGPARVHYAVNCASIGCPNLNTKAFTGANLDAELAAAAKAYVNSPRGVRIVQGKVTASSIYKWFQEDFGNSPSGVLRHLQMHADEALKAGLLKAGRISGYGYNWALNDAK